MASVWIDGKAFEVSAGKNMLEVALMFGFNLPYFCWHPALGSIGACRQCAVKQLKSADDARGRLVMACMTPATDGTRISIDDAQAHAFRQSVIEWLMVNHPHDCPVCDEGGECHLQDMTVMSGHIYRRYRFQKRTFHNQYLGPFVGHEMNRCIACYRCVRYYRDFAGGTDLNVFAAHDHVYFGRQNDGVLESPFAGNLVEVCPTGVFTDKTLGQHYSRKWDLTSAPSLCVHCSLGCNTIPGARYDTVRRVRNRYNDHVNGYFLCDRGRYGYQFVDGERRLHVALAPKGPESHAQQVSGDDALAHLSQVLAEPERLVAIGSPRASLETNFTLRALAGAERFSLGVAASEATLLQHIVQILSLGTVPSATLREVERCDAVLLLGEDVDNTAPMLGLALRQSLRQARLRQAEKLGIPLWQDGSLRELIGEAKGPLFAATMHATTFDQTATDVLHATPDVIASLGFAVAHELDSGSPRGSDADRDLLALATRIAHALREARKPLIVAGTSSRSIAVVQAAANVAWALERIRADHQTRLFYVVPECNSLGVALIGGAPLDDAAERLRRGEADTLVIAENDLYRRAPRPEVDSLLQAASRVVVLDHIATETGAAASLLLPAATFAESDGTLVNNEGRAQRFFGVRLPAPPAEVSWRWLLDAARACGRDPGWQNLDGVLAAMASELPHLAGAQNAAPPASFRKAGAKVAREPHRYSGRTAMVANQTVHEPKPPEDPDAPLTLTMEGYPEPVPPTLLTRVWAPGWNSPQALTRFQEEMGGALRGGESGTRLLEPQPLQRSYFSTPTRRPARPQGTLRVLPRYVVFGSEELSRLAPSIAALAPEPYLTLHPDDAAGLQVVADATVQLELDGRVLSLQVRLVEAQPRGTVGVPFWGERGVATAGLFARVYP